MSSLSSSSLQNIQKKIISLIDERKKYEKEYNIRLKILIKKEKQLLSKRTNIKPGYFSMEEVSKHNTPSDCWVVLYEKVYDLTKFLKNHPGGADIITRYAGKDATSVFHPFHPTGILNTLPKDHIIGLLDLGSVPINTITSNNNNTNNNNIGEHDTTIPKKKKPPLSHVLNVFDFAPIAEQQMSKQGWAYYDSGADDEETLRENREAFKRLLLRPRVLVNVKKVNPQCSLLGYHSTFPVYVTATALGRLAHPEGEVILTRAACTAGIIQLCPTLASCSLEEMTSARIEDKPIQFFQLYVNSNRNITRDFIQRAEKNGCKAIFITVDAPQLGRRERDMKNKFTLEEPNVQKGHQTDKNQGVARAISSFIDPSLCWDDIAWFKSITSLPIVLKGIQCREDAVLAVKHKVSGIVLSNHGGRQLDYARAAIDILPEVMHSLREIGAEDKLEVFIDGGIRRGTDIFKAIALGAKAVGVGRPFLYSLASYGQDGVERAMQMLKDEFEVCMRLMGVTKIDQIRRPGMVMRRLGYSLVDASSPTSIVYSASL